MRVVTVDFDGTLYQGNSFKAMFDVAKKEYNLRQWLAVTSGTIKALARFIQDGKEAAKHSFFHAFVQSLKGKSKEELKTFFDTLARSDLERINRPLVEKVKQHQANGDQIVIVSGALMPFLIAFAEVIELEGIDIIGTDLKYDEKGIATGLMGEIVNGERKAGVVLEWLHSRGLSVDDVTIWAYADSESDSPLFDMVDHPVVVNPDESLEKLAGEKGWPVFGS